MAIKISFKCPLCETEDCVFDIENPKDLERSTRILEKILALQIGKSKGKRR